MIGEDKKKIMKIMSILRKKKDVGRMSRKIGGGVEVMIENRM